MSDGMSELVRPPGGVLWHLDLGSTNQSSVSRPMRVLHSTVRVGFTVSQGVNCTL